VLTLEGGKPLVENVDEVGWTANAFSYYAELGRHERGRVIPSVEDGQLALVLKEPVGTVAAIVPWNYRADCWHMGARSGPDGQDALVRDLSLS